MVVIYHFQKEEIEGGSILRPKVIVRLQAGDIRFDALALLDTGCDITVIPKRIATTLKLSTTGHPQKLYAYRESTDVIKSSVDITFNGRAERQSVTIRNVPVLIAVEENESDGEDEVVLGLHRIFDEFEITFKRVRDRIEMKRVNV